MLQKRYFHLHEWPLSRLWLAFFFLTLILILLVQLVILPFFFSQWHAGEGLLVGGDWISFHSVAVEMAEKIGAEGWEAWELSPRGWMPAGLAAAFYALTWPKPWVLAPLNAAVHASTAIIIINIMHIFTNKRMPAIIASLPFVYFPSAMLWYAQIHRDGYNILGMLLLVLGFLLISRLENKKYKTLPIEVKGLIFVISGILLIWVSRPHVLVIYQYVFLLLTLLVIVMLIYWQQRRLIKFQTILVKTCCLLLLSFLIILLSNTGGADKYERKPTAIKNEQITESSFSVDGFPQEQSVIGSEVKKTSQNAIAEDDFKWKRTSFLPERIDNQLYSIAVLRTVWYPISYGEAASNIDSDVSFHSAFDYILYLPRALQIAFLAPFPSQWFGEGSYETSTFFRSVSAFEMSFIYLILLPLIYALWLWRKRIELYILLIFCTIMMLPIVYSVPNLGTIYRYRYGYLMLLVSLAVVALCEFLAKRKGQDGENTDSSRV